MWAMLEGSIIFGVPGVITFGKLPPCCRELVPGASQVTRPQKRWRDSHEHQWNSQRQTSQSPRVPNKPGSIVLTPKIVSYSIANMATLFNFSHKMELHDIPHKIGARFCHDSKEDDGNSEVPRAQPHNGHKR